MYGSQEVLQDMFYAEDHKLIWQDQMNQSFTTHVGGAVNDRKTRKTSCKSRMLDAKGTISPIKLKILDPQKRNLMSSSWPILHPPTRIH